MGNFGPAMIMEGGKAFDNPSWVKNDPSGTSSVKINKFKEFEIVLRKKVLSTVTGFGPK